MLALPLCAKGTNDSALPCHVLKKGRKKDYGQNVDGLRSTAHMPLRSENSRGQDTAKAPLGQHQQLLLAEPRLPCQGHATLLRIAGGTVRAGKCIRTPTSGKEKKNQPENKKQEWAQCPAPVRDPHVSETKQRNWMSSAGGSVVFPKPAPATCCPAVCRQALNSRVLSQSWPVLASPAVWRGLWERRGGKHTPSAAHRVTLTGSDGASSCFENPQILFC